MIFLTILGGNVVLVTDRPEGVVHSIGSAQPAR